jgi:hypothetical protein
MPVSISKKGGGYEVRTPNKVHAKKTTLKKAKAQERLLNAVEHGWTPRAMGDSGTNMMGKGR